MGICTPGSGRTEAGEGRFWWAHNRTVTQEGSSLRAASVGRARIQVDEQQSVGCTIASSTLALPRARSSWGGRDRKHPGSGLGSRGEPAEVCPFVWVWQVVKQGQDPSAAHSTLPMRASMDLGCMHRKGVGSLPRDPGIVDWTRGGCWTNALFSCLQCLEEEPLPARSEWSRGARRHFY